MLQPTNHLDMETIDVLIEAVAAFKGAIVIVSHDQFFLSRVGKGGHVPVLTLAPYCTHNGCRVLELG